VAAGCGFVRADVARDAEGAPMTDRDDMTTGEADAWRCGYEAAEEKWAAAVLRHVYRCEWGEHKGQWCSGIHGDAPVYPELAALLTDYFVGAMQPPERGGKGETAETTPAGWAPFLDAAAAHAKASGQQRITTLVWRGCPVFVGPPVATYGRKSP
jgi:hypothetical protein